MPGIAFAFQLYVNPRILFLFDIQSLDSYKTKLGLSLKGQMSLNTHLIF